MPGAPAAGHRAGPTLSALDPPVAPLDHRLGLAAVAVAQRAQPPSTDGPAANVTDPAAASTATAAMTAQPTVAFG